MSLCILNWFIVNTNAGNLIRKCYSETQCDYLLISGNKTVAGAQHLKQTSQSIFRAGKFELHKWHSNVPSLEQPTLYEETVEEWPITHQNENQSYAKDQLGVKQGETKPLGVPWDKWKDTIQTSFPDPIMKATKRDIPGKITKIYDPLGLASLITLEGKFLYREVCESRIPWDQEVHWRGECQNCCSCLCWIAAIPCYMVFHSI